MKLRDSFLAVFVIIMWGVNFPVMKIGLEEVPPMLFSALRFIIVAIPAVFFIPFPKTSIWNVLGVAVFLGVFKYSLLFFALVDDASAGLSSLILQSQVFFTIGLSILLFRERISKIQLSGIIIAIIGFSFFLFNSGDNITLVGLSSILLAAFFWAIANLIMMRFKDVNLLHFMIWVSVFPPLPLFVLSYIFETQQPLSLVISMSVQTWWALIFAAYISMLAGFALWGWLLKTYSAAIVTPFALLVPVVGIITSSIFLKETMSGLEVIGAVLIMLGLLFSVLGNRINYQQIRA